VAGLKSLRELVIWDATTRKELLTLPNDCTHLLVTWAPAGRRLAVVRGYSRVEVWDATGKVLAWLPVHRPVTALAFAPDGQTLATGDLDGVIRLWDLRRIDARP
jgi:WD40 repeat protein